jgi:hypothetical protein
MNQSRQLRGPEGDVGLFATIAEHEKAIRSDPVQAGSALLKTVLEAL